MQRALFLVWRWIDVGCQEQKLSQRVLHCPRQCQTQIKRLGQHSTRFFGWKTRRGRRRQTGVLGSLLYYSCQRIEAIGTSWYVVPFLWFFYLHHYLGLTHLYLFSVPRRRFSSVFWGASIPSFDFDFAARLQLPSAPNRHPGGSAGSGRFCRLDRACGIWCLQNVCRLGPVDSNFTYWVAHTDSSC